MQHVNVTLLYKVRDKEGANYDISFMFISTFSGKPSGSPDYTLSQEKVLTDVLNKMWFIYFLLRKTKNIRLPLINEQSPV